MAHNHWWEWQCYGELSVDQKCESGWKWHQKCQKYGFLKPRTTGHMENMSSLTFDSQVSPSSRHFEQWCIVMKGYGRTMNAVKICEDWRCSVSFYLGLWNFCTQCVWDFMMHRSRISSESFSVNFSEFGAQKKQKHTVPKESCIAHSPPWANGTKPMPTGQKVSSSVCLWNTCDGEQNMPNPDPFRSWNLRQQ